MALMVVVLLVVGLLAVVLIVLMSAVAVLRRVEVSHSSYLKPYR